MKKFNENKVLNTCGLYNTGVICYFNSLIQSILSCTSVNEYFLDNEKRFVETNNRIAIEYIKIIKTLKSQSNITLNPQNLFNEFIKEYRRKNPGKTFGNGQEDSGEGLHLILDCINDKGLYKYFTHRYINKIVCINCSRVISKNLDEGCIVEIPPAFKGLKTEENPDKLNNYIRHYSTSLNYKCSKCSNNKCFSVYQLSYSPEILVIMFNKYYNKTIVEFPTELVFPSINNTQIKYKLISKIEHSGSMSGGHYWAHCYRKGDEKNRFYNLNDTSVSQGDTQSNYSTYILFYHIL